MDVSESTNGLRMERIDRRLPQLSSSGTCCRLFSKHNTTPETALAIGEKISLKIRVSFIIEFSLPSGITCEYNAESTQHSNVLNLLNRRQSYLITVINKQIKNRITKCKSLNIFHRTLQTRTYGKRTSLQSHPFIFLLFTLLDH